MAKGSKLVAGIDFIDSTGGAEGTEVFMLVDEKSASTVGVFDSLDALEAAIEALRDMGRVTQEIWGEVRILNQFEAPTF